MKKKILISLLFLTCFSSIIWAVWEGNGGIGSASEFPGKGLFVRSDMFPKHTLLEITNLEKNKTSRAIVLGPSGIPGLLISISPDLGTKLKIPYGKVVRVRILTPSPVQEIGDDGLGIFTSNLESEDSDDNPAMIIANNTETEAVVMEPTSPPPTPVPSQPIEEKDDEEYVFYDDIETEPVNEIPVKQEPEIEKAVEVEPVKEPIVEPKPEPVEVEPVKEPIVEPKPEPVEVEPVKEPIVEPKPEPVEVEPIVEEEPETTVVVETETYMEPTTMRPPKPVADADTNIEVKEVNSPKKPKTENKTNEQNYVAVVSSPKTKQKDANDGIEENAEVLSVDSINEKENAKKHAEDSPTPQTVDSIKTQEKHEEIKNEIPVTEAPPLGEEPKIEKEANIKPEIVTETLPQKEETIIEPEPVEETPSQEEEPIAKPEIVEEDSIVVEETTIEEIPIEKGDDYYTKSPLIDEINIVEEKKEVEEVEKPVKEEEPVVEPEPEIVEEPIAEPVEEETEEPEEVYIAEAPIVKDKDPIRPKSKLQKGKLYVQIVVYNKKEQAEAVIRKYGDLYPMILQEKQGKKRMQYIVIIGPLQEEETGAIMEHFDKLGFRGAFLKRAK